MPTANILKPQADDTHDTQTGLILGPSTLFPKPLLHNKAPVLAFNATWPQWLRIRELPAHTSAHPVPLPACHPALAQPSTTQHVGKEGSRQPLLARITCHLLLAQWLHAVSHCWHLACAAGSCHPPLLLTVVSPRHQDLTQLGSLLAKKARGPVHLYLLTCSVR